jgi:ATP-binding cassette subfamily B protein
MIIYAPLTAIGGIVMAVGKSPSMSWIIALACIVLIGMILVIAAIAMPKFKIMQVLVDKLNLVSRETLGGMMVIRAFNRQEFEKERFAGANGDLADTSRLINRVMALMMPAMTLIMNGTTMLVVWVGAHQIAGLLFRSAI